MSNAIISKIKLFMSNHFLIEFNDSVNEDTNLFRSGFIDSLGLLYLVTFLEQRFKIKITDDALVSDALVSVTNIANCIGRKLHEPA